VFCETSGAVRDAFRALGHDAVSYDILPSEAGGPHVQGDCLAADIDGVDLLIAHPPCTRLCNSGVRWLSERNLWRELDEARRFFLAVLDLWPMSVPRLAVENPIPHRHAQLPRYTQIVQPWMFGDGECKATCLWLRNLPPLQPTHVDAPLFGAAPVRERRQSVHLCPPGPERWRIRSRTFAGIARAMAEQWSDCPVPDNHRKGDKCR
jgi:hypothetical protein